MAADREAFQLWLNRGLRREHAAVLEEELPEEWLRLIGEHSSG